MAAWEVLVPCNHTVVQRLITKEEVEAWDRYYRGAFFNSLAGYKSCNLIGTQNQKGVSNLALFFSVIHVGAHPPLLGILFRPHTVARDTLENIYDNKTFTVNAVHTAWLAKAHLTSAKFAPQESEFLATGLTEEYKADFTAPFVQESEVKTACRLEEHHKIKVNGTIFLVGRIEFVLLNEKMILHDGLIDHTAAQTAAVNGLDSYYQANLLKRFDYARPHQKIKDKNE